jgi:hypothetical protein
MMKNWFAMMAATMVAAMKAQKQRYGRQPSSRSVSAPGKHNPAGSKNLRRAYKEKHQGRGTYEQAKAWYHNLADGRYKAGHQRSITGQPLKF